MRTSLQIEEVDAICKISGSGSVDIRMLGMIHRISIIPPDSHSYDFTLSDSDGYGVFGLTNQTGSITAVVDQPCVGINTLAFSSGGSGSYHIRIVLSASI